MSDCPLCGRATACGWWCLACGLSVDDGATLARFRREYATSGNAAVVVAAVISVLVVVIVPLVALILESWR